MILIITHAVFLKGKDIFGPPHATSEFLNSKKVEHCFVKHDLYAKQPSLIEEYRDGKLQKISKKAISSSNTFERYAKEIWFNLQFARSLRKIEVFIGVDPLNAVIAPILWLLGVTHNSVFFCADFAIKRFDSIPMNLLYHLLDRWCMYFSKQTWSISQRVQTFRAQHGLSEQKNKIVPNAPFFDSVPRVESSKMNRFALVLVSALEKGIDFELLFNAFAQVHKEFQKTQLHIIGSGSLERKLQESVKKMELVRAVHFHGALSHAEMFQKIVRYGIGIALYSDADPSHFRYFSDPMKVRDYLASGLPVLVSGNSAITEEIEKAKVGHFVQLDRADLVAKLSTLLKNEENYLTFHRNALKHAKKYDTYSLFDQYLSDMIML